MIRIKYKNVSTLHIEYTSYLNIEALEKKFEKINSREFIFNGIELKQILTEKFSELLEIKAQIEKNFWNCEDTKFIEDVLNTIKNPDSRDAKEKASSKKEVSEKLESNKSQIKKLEDCKQFLNKKEIEIVVSEGLKDMKSIFDYSGLQPNISEFFEKFINPHTCYYCNIDFINVFQKSYDSIWHYLNTALEEELIGNNGGISGIGIETVKPIIEKRKEIFNKYEDIKFLSSHLQKAIKDFDSEEKFKNIKTRNGFTLDHVLNKDEHPYLALSLFNLVPSCYVCNSKLKGVKSIGERISPTSNDFDFDERVKFKTYFSANNDKLQINTDEDIQVQLKEFGNKYKDYLNVFRLNDRYNFHKYKVIEMIDKRKRYPDSRIQELAQLTGQTPMQVKKDLFGEYLFEKADGQKELDLSKRPLSKLTHDIAEELGLI